MILCKHRPSLLRRLPLGLTLQDAGLFLLLALFSSLVAILYVSSERFYYFWDWGGFQVLAINHARLFLRSIPELLYSINQSRGLEYNYLYVLPLIPPILVFGFTRLGYILSVALVYQLPYALCAAGIAAKLIPGRSRGVFWTAAFLILAIPATWVPTLRGYPDVGGATLVLLAALLYLQDIRLRSPGRSAVIGLLLAAAVIFRRHFAYWVLAFYLSMALQALGFFLSMARRDRARANRELAGAGVSIAAAGLASLALMATVGKPLLLRVLNENYLALYQSYELSITATAGYFLASYGWAICAAAGLSFLVILRRRALNPAPAAFLLLSGGLTLLPWLLLVRQTGPHYTLQFTPLVLVGIVAFFEIIVEGPEGMVRVLALAGAASFLAVNMFLALGPSRLPVAAAPLFSASYPPLYRLDFEEVGRLVAYLREIAPNGDPIYVADSSLVMNPDIIIKAEEQLYGVENSKLDVLDTPQIDSRDFYPLEPLLEARYVLFSTPFQRHISADEQKVVQVVSQAFLQGWEISRDFTQLPEQFHLGENVTLSIYRRTKETSPAAALRTYEQMKGYIGRRPGSQPGWILLNQQASRLFFLQDVHAVSHFQFRWSLADSREDILLLFSGELPEEGAIKGQVGFEGEGCSPALLGLNALNASGQTIDSAEQSVAAPAEAQDFALPFQRRGAAYLLFFLRHEGEGPDSAQESCILRLDVRRAGPGR